MQRTLPVRTVKKIVTQMYQRVNMFECKKNRMFKKNATKDNQMRMKKKKALNGILECVAFTN